MSKAFVYSGEDSAGFSVSYNTDDNRLMEAYFREIMHSQPITRADEVAFFTRKAELEQELAVAEVEGDGIAIVSIQAALEALCEQVVSANLRFVITVAKTYQNRGIPLIELIALGNTGLLKAYQRFDYTRGFKFISYAVHWIRQAILCNLQGRSRTVRVPLSRVELARCIYKLRQREEHRLGRKLSLDEIFKVFRTEVKAKGSAFAKFTNVGYEHFIEVLTSVRNEVSLQDTTDEFPDVELIDTLSVDEPSPDENAIDRDQKNLLVALLGRLNERERKIIEYHWGVNGRPQKTLEQIGVIFGLTRERIRQLEERALKELQQYTVHSLKLSKEEVFYDD